MIYIASPYTHIQDDVMEARFKLNEAVTAFWMRQGLPVFSPIVHCRQIALLHELPHDFAYWKRMNCAWIDAAKAVWVLQFPNWKLSVGVAGEIAHAEETGKDVLCFTWEEIKGISQAPNYHVIVEDSIALLESL